MMDFYEKSLKDVNLWNKYLMLNSQVTQVRIKIILISKWNNYNTV